MSLLSLGPMPLSFIFEDEDAQPFTPAPIRIDKDTTKPVLAEHDLFERLQRIDIDLCTVRTPNDHNFSQGCSEETLIISLRDNGFEPLPPYIGWHMLQNQSVIPAKWRIRDFSWDQTNAKTGAVDRRDGVTPMVLYFPARLALAAYPIPLKDTIEEGEKERTTKAAQARQSFAIRWDGSEWQRKYNTYNQTMVRNSGIVCIQRNDLKRLARAA